MAEPTALVDESGRRIAAGVLRCIAAAVLLIVAVQWSRNPMWSGYTNCEVTEGVCHESRMESYAPISLWIVTAVGTLLVCLVAVATGPKAFRWRMVWAVAIGASVVVAHSNNLLWAAAVTALSVYLIASTTDDVPLHVRQEPERVSGA